MRKRLLYFALILSLLSASGCTEDPPLPLPVAPPVIGPDSDQKITNTTLFVNLRVNPKNSSTSVIIEYGETTAYGRVVYITPTPIEGDGDVVIAAGISGLNSGQSYHWRVKATNSEGTVYGEDRNFITTVIDADGNTYGIVTIGEQTWMTENLKTTKYWNGDLIGTSDPATLDLTNSTEPKYQWAAAGNEENVAIFGRLYTWYAAADPRKLCPDGWHLPSDEEWTVFENTLIAGGYNYDGTLTGYKVAKALSSTEYWDLSSVYGSAGNTDYPEKRNATGFNARPAGYRDYFGPFSTIGGSTFWWTSTTPSPSFYSAIYRAIQYKYEFVSKNGYNKRNGFSVRCIRD